MCGVVVLAVEYFLERFPIFALALFVIGGFGWLLSEIKLEMDSLQNA